MPIPVIDLFAGPGGLGEGFSSLRDEKGRPVFKIRLSIENNFYAHGTLELRSLFRQFPDGEAPDEYYRYIRQEGITREELFAAFMKTSEAAKREAWYFTLNKSNAMEIDSRIKEVLKGYEHWILIGGPPCQAYSIAGRNRMRGHNPTQFEKDQRHFLYKEYLRIIASHRPAIFVMENVKGLLSSRVAGRKIFPQILNDLERPCSEGAHYSLYPLCCDELFHKREASDFIVYAERHGVPQARHRVFILGVRNDVRETPGSLGENAQKSTAWDAICDLPALRSGLSRETDDVGNWIGILKKCFTSMKEMTDQKSVIAIARDACQARSAMAAYLTRGGEYIRSSQVNTAASNWLKKNSAWFYDRKLKGVCNHFSKAHMREDLFRYFFAACYAEACGVSPRIADMPEELRPAHRNVKKAVAGEMFSDRFRVQLKDRPSATIVSHISKDGHYFIHPDPVQCRSLTVREAARLQTFPDNYFFEGPRTAQYTQVGNAVPPLLAREIAKIVKNVLR